MNNNSNIRNSLPEEYKKIWDEMLMQVDTNISFDRVILSDENKEKCSSSVIDLSFDPSKVRLDMTNSNYLNASNVSTEQIDNYDYINGITFKVDALSSTVVRFYKVDASLDYTYPFVNDSSIIEFNHD